jgi:hypothetical protein
MGKAAVDIIIVQLEKLIPSGNQLAIGAIFAQAKEIEKKQIMDAYNQGYRDCEVDLNDYSMNEDIAEFTDAEQYFKQTYGD